MTKQIYGRARVAELTEEADQALYNLVTTEKWLEHSNKTGLFDQKPELEMVALSRLEEQRREYARAYTEHRAAQLAAEQEPGEGESTLTYEQNERLTRLILHTDAFANARILLEDLSEEALGQYERWLLVDALCEAHDAASAEVDLYKRELGLEVDSLRGEEGDA